MDYYLEMLKMYNKEVHPHMCLSKVSKKSPQLWGCPYCWAVGTFEEVGIFPCTEVVPPCKYCGETPECSPSCPGMADLLGSLARSDDVYIAGLKDE